MKTVFMGNHTVGCRVLSELIQSTTVAAVVAHPDHPDDGTLYESVKALAVRHSIPAYQFGKSDADRLQAMVTAARPDLIVVADYRFILQPGVLALPPLGSINFHPSLLPRYRGRAPVNWAMIHGETECGLTVHFMDAGVDTGDIVLQRPIPILFEDTINDIHEKFFPLYASMTRELIALFKAGHVPRLKQDHTQATIFPARKPEDGRIDWRKTSLELYNFVRAVTRPYPGAFTFLNGRKIFIWRAQIDQLAGAAPAQGRPGEIASVDEAAVTVQTGAGRLMLNELQLDGHPPQQSGFKALFSERMSFAG